MGRANIIAGRRKTLHKMQRGFCEYCHKSVKLEDATVDHRTPTSRGGTDDMSNLCMSCATCNEAKGRRTREEFLRWMINSKPKA